MVKALKPDQLAEIRWAGGTTTSVGVPIRLSGELTPSPSRPLESDAHAHTEPSASNANPARPPAVPSDQSRHGVRCGTPVALDRGQVRPPGPDRPVGLEGVAVERPAGDRDDSGEPADLDRVGTVPRLPVAQGAERPLAPGPDG